MPDSSIILSKRNKKSFFQTSQVYVFITIFFVIAVIGSISYIYVLANGFIQPVKSQPEPEITPVEVVVNKEPLIPSIIKEKPDDKFIGLGEFSSTGFINTTKFPINLFTGTTVSTEKQNNLRLRPWAVMMKNNPTDRSQTAISEADIVYEAVEELGVTSLLGIYYENRPVEIGPVGDLRYYFASFAQEYSPFLIFSSGPESTIDKPNLVDQSVDIYKYIGTYGLYSISQEKNDDTIFSKVVNGAETQNFLDISMLYNYLGKIYGSYLWVDSDSYSTWPFKDDQPSEKQTKEVSFNFWDLTDYQVKWVYNPGQNNYLRFQGGVAFTDKKSGSQVKTKNIVLIFAKESQVTDANSHLKYELVGEGDAYLYLDGGLIEGKWRKLTATSKTRFYDASGLEIKFNRGNIWFEILPLKSRLKVINTNN